MLADNMILLEKKTKNLLKWLDLIDRKSCRLQGQHAKVNSIYMHL